MREVYKLYYKNIFKPFVTGIFIGSEKMKKKNKEPKNIQELGFIEPKQARKLIKKLEPEYSFHKVIGQCPDYIGSIELQNPLRVIGYISYDYFSLVNIDAGLTPEHERLIEIYEKVTSK